MPALAFWPFVSAMPAFTLASASSAKTIASSSLFLLTGFWAFIVLYIAYRIVIGRMQRAGLKTGPVFGGLAVGIYATFWTAAYGIFTLL